MPCFMFVYRLILWVWLEKGFTINDTSFEMSICLWWSFEMSIRLWRSFEMSIRLFHRYVYGLLTTDPPHWPMTPCSPSLWTRTWTHPHGLGLLAMKSPSRRMNLSVEPSSRWGLMTLTPRCVCLSLWFLSWYRCLFACVHKCSGCFIVVVLFMCVCWGGWWWLIFGSQFPTLQPLVQVL